MLGNSQMGADSEETTSEREEPGEVDAIFLVSEALERRGSGREEKASSSPESIAVESDRAYFKPGGRVPIRSRVIPLLSAVLILLISFTTLLSGSFAASGRTKTRSEATFQKAACP